MGSDVSSYPKPLLDVLFSLFLFAASVVSVITGSFLKILVARLKLDHLNSHLGLCFTKRLSSSFPM